ncbi:MAG: FtsK/SpoIIIE family DNA translocase [Armatimonadota bacterium]
MAKTRKKPDNDPLFQDLAGIGVTALGAMQLVGLLWPESGWLVKWLGWSLRTISGYGAYAVPLALIIVGYILITGSGIPTTKRKMVGLLILFAVFISWCQLWRTPDVLALWDSRTSETPEQSRIFYDSLLHGGGYLGFGIVLVLVRIFGRIGVHIILTVGTISSILLITGLTINTIVSIIRDNIRSAAKPREDNIKLKNRRNAVEKIRHIEEPVKEVKKDRTGLLSIFKHKPDADTDKTIINVELDGKHEKPKVIMNGIGAKKAEKPAETRPPVVHIEGDYQLPPITILKEPQPQPKRAQAELNYKIDKIEKTLEEFKIEADVVEVSHGPTVTRYEIQLAPGIKVSKIVSLADNIAMALAAIDVRVEAPIPGKSAIGVEVPNDNPAVVTLREVVDTNLFRDSATMLSFPLGKDVAGEPRYADLTKMPHMLIAGSTNSGKSVCINTLIAGILFRATPRDVKFILIDPKRVELSMYDGIPHLMTPVVKDVRQAAGILRSTLKEMEHRYDLFVQVGTRNFDGYNQKVPKEQKLPYIVVIVDELADLMMQAGPDVEFAVCRLAQLARATGIHLVIATQRPSVDVVTGTIKANISSRISFAVNSQIDSRTILDQGGAERLIGRGDMLFKPIDASKPTRIQGCYVTEKEIEDLVKHLKEQELPDYSMEPMSIGEAGSGGGGAEDASTDETYEPAVKLVVTSGYASTSMLQRRFKIGYTRAARLVDTMEEQGIVGPLDGAKPREVLIGKEDLDRIFGKSLYGEEISPVIDEKE